MGIVLVWLACAFIGAIVGDKKGAATAGFLWGLFLGPIGILIAVLMTGDRVDCPHCKEKINPEASVCPRCQREVVPRSLQWAREREAVSHDGSAKRKKRWDVAIVGVIIIAVLVVAETQGAKPRAVEDAPVVQQGELPAGTSVDSIVKIGRDEFRFVRTSVPFQGDTTILTDEVRCGTRDSRNIRMDHFGSHVIPNAEGRRRHVDATPDEPFEAPYAGGVRDKMLIRVCNDAHTMYGAQ